MAGRGARVSKRGVLYHRHGNRRRHDRQRHALSRTKPFSRRGRLFTLSTTLDDIDEARTCGQWELLAAGPGVVRRAQLGIAAGRETELTGDFLTAEAVFAAARRGDALAREIVAETVRLIRIGVSKIGSLMNPDIVILGGGIGAQADLILEPVRCIVRTWAQPVSGNSVQIECSRLGDDAGLLGAAYGAFERVRNSKGGEPAKTDTIKR